MSESGHVGRAGDEVDELRARLTEAEQTLQAIRTGDVDALVVAGPSGEQIYTLSGADSGYRTIVEQMQEGAVTIDGSGLILYANRRFIEMVAHPADEVMGRSIGTFLEEHNGFTLDSLFRSNGPTARQETRLRMILEPVPVQIAVNRLELRDTAPMYVLVVTDLTLLHQKNKLMKSEQHQARQLRALATELTYTEQRERARLAQVLHDHLQQLIVAASMKAGRLGRREISSDAQDQITQVQELLRQAVKASRDLTMELSPPILYEAGVGAALGWLARQMHERHGLTVEVQAPDGVSPAAQGVGLFLFSAARELLFNVVKHGGVTSARVIVAPLSQEMLRLTVEDEGVGFDTAVLEQRGSQSFGLFSIRDRLELLGGRLDVTSSPGQGTRVLLEVPIVAQHSREPYPLKLTASSLAAPALGSLPLPRESGGRVRILLVDDHTILRQGLASLLANEPDMETVAEASNGAEAIELTRLLRPDVILMDASMPEMNGLEATRRIVALFPQTVVIGLSMYDSEDMSKAMQSAGARAYVTKEKASEELCSVIRAVVAQGRQQPRAS